MHKSTLSGDYEATFGLGLSVSAFLIAQGLQRS
jgi:hypothetical protein